jgi:hypothetical protein
MHAARFAWRAARVRLSPLIREDGDEAAVAGIEIEMAFRCLVEIGLLKHEGHAEDALPEVDGRLAIGAIQGDVVHALAM